MQKTQTVCLVILTTIAVGFSLYYLQSVLLPFVIALFVVVGCQPILEFFETKLKLSRYLAFAVAFSIGTLVLVGFVLLTWLSINDLARNSAAYETRLNNMAQWAADFLHKSADVDANQNGTKTNPAADAQPDGDAKPGDVETNTRQAINEIVDAATAFLQSQVLRFAGSLSNLLSYGVLILIFVFFLMLGQESRQRNQPEIVREVENQVRRYLVMKTAISAVTGIAFGLVLWFFGVPLAIVFGFLAFLLNFIPNFGPLISTLTPVPFLVLNAEMSPLAAIVCFVLCASIHFISGNVIETRLMGKSFDVSPVILLMALMFFGLVWGIIGMFLATPITSIVKIILQQNESTRPLGELIAGRWSTANNADDG